MLKCLNRKWHAASNVLNLIDTCGLHILFCDVQRYIILILIHVPSWSASDYADLSVGSSFHCEVCQELSILVASDVHPEERDVFKQVEYYSLFALRNLHNGISLH